MVGQKLSCDDVIKKGHTVYSIFKSIFLFNEKFLAFIEKKRKCILQVPPYKSPLFRINHIWSFFLKIKGYLVQLNISKEAGFNKIKFLSTLKNIFEINSLKIQKNLEFINFRQVYK